MRLIDANKIVYSWQIDADGQEHDGVTLQSIIDKMPTINPEPRKKGKWIANGDIHKECPFCGEDWDKYVFGEVWYTDELPKFCPNCGADMREGEEE